MTRCHDRGYHDLFFEHDGSTRCHDCSYFYGTRPAGSTRGEVMDWLELVAFGVALLGLVLAVATQAPAVWIIGFAIAAAVSVARTVRKP